MCSLLVAAACLLAAPAQAAPVNDRPPVQSVLRAMEMDLRAIRDGSLPIDGIQRIANEVHSYVSQVSLVADNGSPAVRSIEIGMRTHADALITLAYDPNPIETAGPADDLLKDIERLRGALGTSP
jgi:hypothetical protein